MRKKFINLSLAVALSLSLSLLCGCGKDEKKNIATTTDAVSASTSDVTTANNTREFTEEYYNSMLDKYSAFCSLSDYKGLEYEPFSTEVTDDMINSRVDALLNSVATEKKVTEGTTKDGDTVNIDYVGSVDGVEFPGGSSNGQGYNLTLGSGKFIPGMEEQIMNHEVGENFDINVTFPDPYQSADLAGKDAVFNITINYIVELEKPEYTDDIIASYTDATSVAEYESMLKDEISQMLENQADSVNRNTVMDLVLENTTVNSYPEDEINSLTNDVIVSFEDTAKANGMSLEDLVKQFYNMDSVDAFKDYLTEAAQSYLNDKIIVCAIAKAENITLTKEDITAYEERVMTSNGMDRTTFENAYTMDDVVYFVLSEKVNDFLFENAVAK